MAFFFFVPENIRILSIIGCVAGENRYRNDRDKALILSYFNIALFPHRYGLNSPECRESIPFRKTDKTVHASLQNPEGLPLASRNQICSPLKGKYLRNYFLPKNAPC
jgi:hypothetical protein